MTVAPYAKRNWKNAAAKNPFHQTAITAAVDASRFTLAGRRSERTAL